MPTTVTAPAPTAPVHSCQATVCHRERVDKALPGWRYTVYMGFHQWCRSNEDRVVLDCRNPEHIVLTMPGGINLPLNWEQLAVIV